MSAFDLIPARPLIRGSGDDAPAPPGEPIESDDSLRSLQFASMTYAICEGEIKGLVNGAQSIFADDTPLQNPDGSYNFDPVSWCFVPGIQGQPSISGSDGAGAEVSVGVEVLTSQSVTRTINQPVNAVRVTISIPQMVYNDNKGNRLETSVSYAIDVQTRGGGYERRIEEEIFGKTTTLYQRSYMIDVSGDPPWDFRVVRLSTDSSGGLVNKTYWTSYTLINRTPLAYPNTALLGIRTDARAYSALPSMSVEAYLKIIQIPSNYDPYTRTYTGVWDGTFKYDWSDNPAWAWFDMCTHNRYGLGEYITQGMMDKWQLYEIAQWCDQLVPDGNGGMEPRFTCNVIFQSRDEALRLLQVLAGSFRGAAFWSTSTISAVADMPGPVIKRFGPTNVEGGKFNYEGSARTARHTVALVSWNDPLINYKQNIEPVIDWEGVARYGVVETEVISIGCISRGQAHRCGRSILNTELSETESVNFNTGTDVAGLFPGAIFETFDPKRAGVRFTGRLIAASTTEVQIDAPVLLEIGKTYTLLLTQPDGTLMEVAVNPAYVDGQEHTTIGFASAIAPENVPIQWAMWFMRANDLVLEQWRCAGIKETAKGKYAVSGIAYREGKYAAIDDGTVFDPPPPSSYLSSTQAPPTDLMVSESITYINNLTASAQLDVGWVMPVGGAVAYMASWRVNKGNWNRVNAVTCGFEIPSAKIGQYEFEVRAVNALGKTSRSLTGGYNFTGTNLASPVTNLRLSTPFDTPDASFVWDAVAEATHYEVSFVSASDVLLYTVNRLTPDATYTFAQNKADNAGVPQRTVRIRVTTVSALGRSVPVALNVTNAQLPAPTVSVQQAWDAVLISCNAPGGDYLGTRMLASTDPACPVDTTQPYYDGPNTSQPSPAFLPGTIYCRAAQYDIFGISDLNWSSVVAITLNDVASGVPSVADASIITAPTGSLPPGGASYNVVLDLATRKMYTWHPELDPARYTSSVQAGDISGQLVDSQIAAIAAGKVTGQLTNAQIAALAASKLTGQISNTQISDDAISSPKIAAGAITAGKLAADSVTASAVAADAITAAKIAAGSVTTAKLEAGAVSAEKIAAGAVTADKVDAAYTNTTVLQARTAVVDFAYANTLSALSAYLGNIVGATMSLTGTGWNYIRTDSKWWNDGVNGWITAANASLGEYFHEFRAINGSAIVHEKKAGGGGFGAQYYLQVRNPAGVDVLLFDPANGVMKFKGDVSADSGYFSGNVTSAATILGASGYFGTITSGMLRNADNSSFLNLNATGNAVLMHVAGVDRVWANGKQRWNNYLAGGWITINKPMAKEVYVAVDDGSGDGGTVDVYDHHEFIEQSVDYYLPQTFDIGEFNASSFSVAIGGWTFKNSNGYSDYQVHAHGDVFSVMPEKGASWTGCRLMIRITVLSRTVSTHSKICSGVCGDWFDQVAFAVLTYS